MEDANCLDYILAVNGVFGRNKKRKYETVALAKHVQIDKPKKLEELIPIMRLELLKLKTKPGCNYQIEERPIKVENTCGFDVETFELMSERVMLKGVVGGSEQVSADES